MSLLTPGPEGCTCLWVGALEFWADDPVTVWTLQDKDRRCVVHGKPRWRDRSNALSGVRKSSNVSPLTT